MNLRKWLYFNLVRMRGQALGTYYARFLHEFQNGVPVDTPQRLLSNLFNHCQEHVPFYADIMHPLGNTFTSDPVDYLQRMPILTKAILRLNYNECRSNDSGKRHCYVNSTGGSTGTPIQVIQDWDYSAQAGAITMLFSKLVGKEYGEKEIVLWGSMHDIDGTTASFAARVVNKISNHTFLSVLNLDCQTIQRHIQTINRIKPKLIIAYVEAAYEIARFAEREGLDITPIPALITSAGTLYPFMREKIEQVFHTHVYNRYGSREVGDIACELPGIEGLWVAPWANYIEIVDSDGNQVKPGIEGNILVTSLLNYSMPLIRYEIGDRGILMEESEHNTYPSIQILQNVTGRTTDIFINKDGHMINGMLFHPLMAYKDWIKKFQVIQKERESILIKIVHWGIKPEQEALDTIKSIARRIMAAECKIDIEFVDDIEPTPSGKYRYIISDVER